LQVVTTTHESIAYSTISIRPSSREVSAKRRPGGVRPEVSRMDLAFLPVENNALGIVYAITVLKISARVAK